VNPAESTEDQNDANVDPNELMEELSVKVEKLYDLMLVRQDQLAALKMELSSMTETSETYRETVDKQQHLLKQIGELRNVLNECISTLSDMDSAENSNLTNTVTKSVSGKDLKPAVRVVKSAIDGAFTATHGPKFAAEPFSSAQLQRKRLIQSLLQQHRQLKMSSAMAVADEGAPPLNAIKRTKPRCVFSKTPRFPNGTFDSNIVVVLMFWLHFFTCFDQKKQNRLLTRCSCSRKQCSCMFRPPSCTVNNPLLFPV
jgi:hypothetical protein